MPVVQKLTLLKDIMDVPKGTTILVVTLSEANHSTSGVMRALRKAGFTDDHFDNTVNDLSNWKFQVISEIDPGELNLQLAKFSEPIHADSTPSRSTHINSKSFESNSSVETRLSQPIPDITKQPTSDSPYDDDSERNTKPILDTSKTSTSKLVDLNPLNQQQTSITNDDIFQGKYWNFWKELFGSLFWLFLPIPLFLGIPYLIIKFIIKFIWWIVKSPFVVLKYIFLVLIWLLNAALFIVTFGLLGEDPSKYSPFDN